MMVATIVAISGVASGWPNSAALAAKVVVGAIVYVAALIGAWRLLGRPKGAEAELLRLAAGKLGIAARNAGA
jgi:hypothetical protein